MDISCNLEYRNLWWLYYKHLRVTRRQLQVGHYTPIQFSLAEFKADSKSEGSSSSGNKFDPTIPKEFLCAINGHVMKDPVRCKTTGLVFERETIELWLQTRGAVCPITNSHLEKSDLVSAEDLRNQ